MLKKLPIILGPLLAIFVCARMDAWAGDGSVLGTGLGAAIGGLFGSQFGHGSGRLAATSTGIVVGGLIGNRIGQSVDAEAYSTRSSPIPLYSEAVSSPYRSSPNYVAPPALLPTYIDEQAGTYCREYSQEIRIEGHVQESYGTACLQPDGTWRIVQ